MWFSERTCDRAKSPSHAAPGNVYIALDTPGVAQKAASRAERPVSETSRQAMMGKRLARRKNENCVSRRFRFVGIPVRPEGFSVAGVLLC